MSSRVQAIVDRLIYQLPTGDAPWLHVWQPGAQYLPVNPATGRSFSAINAVSLASMAIERDWTDPRWMTERQAERLGATIRPGEAPAEAVAWQYDQRLPNGQVVQLERPRLAVHDVWNATQMDGLSDFEPMAIAPDAAQRAVDAIRQGSQASMLIDANGGPTRYDPHRDAVLLKDRGENANPRIMAIEQVHAMAHWTGHESRLGRDIGHPIGSLGDAREELRANIASMLLGDRLGTGWHPGSHVTYTSQWVEVLEKDPTEILRVCADAEDIAKYIVGLSQEQEQAQQQDRNVKPVYISQTHPAVARQPDVQPPGRQYLAVPFAEKDQAKAAGARYDRENKAWFAPPGADTAKFDRWKPDPAHIKVAGAENARDAFADELRRNGFVLGPQDPVMNGRVQNCAVDGDRGRERSGTYLAHADGVPNGWYQNFKIHAEHQKWVMRRTQAQTITPADREALRAMALQAKEATERERATAHHAAAERYQAIWDKAIEGQSHAYLERKNFGPTPETRIAAPGTTIAIRRRQDDKREGTVDIDIGGRLLVPMRGSDGALRSLQIIDDNGGKLFAPDGEAQGSHLVIGEIGPWPIGFAEGYSKGRRLHEAIGLPVVVTFSAHNMPRVAEGYREMHPNQTFFMFGDNNHDKPFQRDPQGRPKKNVGKEAAERAAELSGGHVILPPFQRGDKGTDWEDFAEKHGDAELKRELTTQTTIASRTRIAQEIGENREWGQTKQRKRGMEIAR